MIKMKFSCQTGDLVTMCTDGGPFTLYKALFEGTEHASSQIYVVTTWLIIYFSSFDREIEANVTTSYTSLGTE